MICSFFVPLSGQPPPVLLAKPSHYPASQHPSWPLISALPALGLGVHRDGCVNIWEQLGKVGISQACAPGSGSLHHFFSTAAAPLPPPRVSPAFESTSRRKPAIPQTATRWCHKLMTGLLPPAPSRRNAEQTRCPKRQLGAPHPKHLLFPSGVTLAPAGWPSGPCFQPCGRSYGLAPTSSCCPSPCRSVSPCSSSSIPLHLSLSLSLSPSVSPFFLSLPVLCLHTPQQT